MIQRNRKTPLVFRIGIILLCAMLLSLHLMGGLFARYVASSSASDSARVAYFKVSEIIKKGDVEIDWSTDVNMKPGDSVNYFFELKNDSEVVLRYYVVSTNVSDNLPLTINQPSVNIAPGDTQTLTCTISWPGTENDADLCGMTDLIKFAIKLEQVD